MLNISRREFIGGALAGSAALLAPRSAGAADAKVEILIGEQLGTVAPEIYSHFIEHLGGVIYDGVWVGEGSKIPNVGGVRAALIERLRKIKPAVVRWPGGCFADQYNWRDGIGPRSERPQRTNFWISDSTKDSDSPPGLRDEPFRHQRVHALLQAHRCRALPRRQPAEPDGERLL